MFLPVWKCKCLPRRHFPSQLPFQPSPSPCCPRGRELGAAVAADYVDYHSYLSVVDSLTPKPQDCFVCVPVNVVTECRRFRWGRREQSSVQICSLFSQRGERKRGLLEKGAVYLSRSSSTYNNVNHNLKTSPNLLFLCNRSSRFQYA